MASKRETLLFESKSKSRCQAISLPVSSLYLSSPPEMENADLGKCAMAAAGAVAVVLLSQLPLN